MALFVVRWEIHVTALSGAHALDVAREYLATVGQVNGANVFTVRLPSGRWVELNCTEVDRMKN